MYKEEIAGLAAFVLFVVIVSALTWALTYEEVRDSMRAEAVAAGAAVWNHSPTNKDAVFTWVRPAKEAK